LYYLGCCVLALRRHSFLLFRPDPALHAEQFKIVNVATNEELASVGG
jgi:hypothetical protein